MDQRQTNSRIDPVLMLLKPGPFRLKSKGGSEQLLQDFMEYVETMEKFFMATAALAAHTNRHMDCVACTRAKAMLALFCGKEMDSLMKHVSKVLEVDTYTQAINKVKAGIIAQTNQCKAQLKLMQEMSQGGQTFAEWWPKIVEQAEQCILNGYDAKVVAGDPIVQ